MSFAFDQTSWFQRYIRQVATATQMDGMTASKVDTYAFLQPVDAWGFPKHPGKTVILPPEADLIPALETFVTTHWELLNEADAWLGTWVNPHTHQCYLDITTSRAGLAEARRVAAAVSAQEGRRSLRCTTHCAGKPCTCRLGVPVGLEL